MRPSTGLRTGGWLALAGALCLAACGGAPNDSEREWPAPKPALWEVSGEHGEQAWLFGTIHALPGGAEWRTPLLESVLGQAGVLVVEVANLGDPAAVADAFAAVSSSPGLPPLLSRVPAQDRPALAAAIGRAGMEEADFATTESWAAALLIANAARDGDADNGVDRVLLAGGLPAAALEGYAEQFAIFDRLAADDQAELLRETAEKAAPVEERALVEAWIAGDTAALEREMNSGMLTDPELREALLTARNRAWAERIARLLARGRRPLVAVGAAHLLGPDGLPALLAARGYTVRRIQ